MEDITAVQQTLLVIHHIMKKTGKWIELLIGNCSICVRKKSMTVSDNTMQAERLGDFFKNLCKKGPNVSKKLAKNLSSNPGLDFTANFATTVASRNFKKVVSSNYILVTLFNLY